MTNWACATIEFEAFSLSFTKGRRVKPYTPPAFIIPQHYDQHQMLTIPGQCSQSMLGRTKADLQQIGSTLLTACNLLMSLARPHRAGVRSNRRVCPPSCFDAEQPFALKSPTMVCFHCCCCTCLPTETHKGNQSLTTVNFSLDSLCTLKTHSICYKM